MPSNVEIGVVFLNCYREINFGAPSRVRKGFRDFISKLAEQFVLLFDI
jgi:hypothetical protein